MIARRVLSLSAAPTYIAANSVHAIVQIAWSLPLNASRLQPEIDTDTQPIALRQIYGQ
jgi:hypothetical protein